MFGLRGCEGGGLGRGRGGSQAEPTTSAKVPRPAKTAIMFADQSRPGGATGSGGLRADSGPTASRIREEVSDNAASRECVSTARPRIRVASSGDLSSSHQRERSLSADALCWRPTRPRAVLFADSGRPVRAVADGCLVLGLVARPSPICGRDVRSTARLRSFRCRSVIKPATNFRRLSAGSTRCPRSAFRGGG
jgi:hypothetical protein